jgi:uncharacterized membrane protein YdjX (TVP38/TMEM64 family)
MANPIVEHTGRIEHRVSSGRGGRFMGTSRAAVIRLVALALLMFGALLVAWRLGWFDYDKAMDVVRTLRRGSEHRGAIAVFVFVMAGLAAVGFPTTPLLLAGGAIFGTVTGAFADWLGGTLGAALGYVLARSIGKDAILKLLGDRTAQVIERVNRKNGFLAILRLRLIPLFPQGVVNFGAGMAGTPFRPYVLATAIGIIPTALLYSYFADSLLSGIAGTRRHAMSSLLMACGALVVVSFVPTILRKLRGDSAA